jgi:hypothetical protein
MALGLLCKKICSSPLYSPPSTTWFMAYTPSLVPA